MPLYYDDNFGAYEIESEEDLEFYHAVQRESVWKKCSICGRRVKLRAEYDKCNSCVSTLELGGDPNY